MRRMAIRFIGLAFAFPTMAQGVSQTDTEAGVDVAPITEQFNIDRSDRNHPRTRTLTLSGEEFTRRYLRHVQPAKLRAVRYCGYHHPAAKAKRQRVQKGSGKAGNDEARMTNDETRNSEPIVEKSLPKCPCCQQPMPRIARIFPGWQRRIITQPKQSRAPPSEPNRGPQA